ncbi:hypothetical protein TRFO_05078 [Tritrichomonas foetus]|uniref:Uncharacterized protein n=1 Tax=Tritrichomonas foetus TaxID=1144522 RepID=A0A1J4K968_9EUKA|nr:hypothetical protein TRFO_05078 [Tritrichomonas foetus]|eukprot:OHT07951.1 hypothetical protein TRFO_05078 [Tritrichomonas foetus]
MIVRRKIHRSKSVANSKRKNTQRVITQKTSDEENQDDAKNDVPRNNTNRKSDDLNSVFDQEKQKSEHNSQNLECQQKTLNGAKPLRINPKNKCPLDIKSKIQHQENDPEGIQKQACQQTIRSEPKSTNLSQQLSSERYQNKNKQSQFLKSIRNLSPTGSPKPKPSLKTNTNTSSRFNKWLGPYISPVSPRKNQTNQSKSSIDTKKKLNRQNVVPQSNQNKSLFQLSNPSNETQNHSLHSSLDYGTQSLNVDDIKRPSPKPSPRKQSPHTDCFSGSSLNVKSQRLNRESLLGNNSKNESHLKGANKKIPDFYEMAKVNSKGNLTFVVCVEDIENKSMNQNLQDKQRKVMFQWFSSTDKAKVIENYFKKLNPYQKRFIIHDDEGNKIPLDVNNKINELILSERAFLVLE